MDRALDDILITQDQRDDLWLLDLIFTGRDRATGDYLYIAAETSITIGDDDVTRAADRAATLASIVKQPVTAAVIAAHIDDERRSLAASRNVTLIPHPET